MTRDLPQLTADFERSSKRIDSARAQLGERTVAYLSGMLVESAVDRQCMDLSPVWSRFPTTIPRVIRLPGRLQKHPTITHFLFRSIDRCWRIVFPAFVMLQAMRFAWRKLRTGRANRQPAGQPVGEIQNVVFANSPRFHEVLPPLVPQDAVWVTTAAGVITGQPTCSVLANVTWGEFFATIVACLKLNRQTAGLIPSDGSRMQFYSAFVWHLTWFGLQRISANAETIWFANHYDRWAFLIDGLPVNAQTNLVQHGMLYGDRLIPSRLNHISNIYVFDADSEAVFRQLITNPDVKFVRSQYTLSLTQFPRRAADEKIVLLVGNLLHVKDEERLVSACLDLDANIRILVKPHPRSDQTHYQKMAGDGVELVVGAKTFPDADIVLTPESTLGKEYEATGTPVIWYTRISIDEVQQQLTAAIENGHTGSGRIDGSQTAPRQTTHKAA